MAIERFLENMNIIGPMSDNPRLDGLTAQDLRDAFDKHGLLIQQYINEVLAPAIDAINSGAIVMGATKPSVYPVLWLDTSGEYTQIAYVDNLNTVRKIYPITSFEAVEGLAEEFLKYRTALGYVEVTLPAENWSASEPYTQIITVPGMTQTWKAGTPDLLPKDTIEEDIAAMDDFPCLSKISPGNGTMTFICYEYKPEVDLSLRIPGRMNKEVADAE